MAGYTCLPENSKKILERDNVDGVYRNMRGVIIEVIPKRQGA